MKENQSKTQEKKYQIPMEVTEEVIRDFGIKREEVVFKKIGNRKCQVIMVDATETLYKAYMEPIWSEQKRMDREKRCLVSGKSGKLIRCPESNRCENCRYASKVCLEKNRPASISFLVAEGIEPAAIYSFEDEADNQMFLDNIICILSDINPKYGEIFELLYDGISQQEIADELGMKQRTVSDYVKKIRAIVQPLAKDAFNW
ncbi:MAG: hypothetical protein LIO62_06050 [Clostridiales bacterium]|nr:hypothetical protein [Clostridiales bacterium]